MWLEGDWNAVAGMFLKIGIYLHHIIDEKDLFMVRTSQKIHTNFIELMIMV